jgi:hypothetical protein
MMKIKVNHRGYYNSHDTNHVIIVLQHEEFEVVKKFSSKNGEFYQCYRKNGYDVDIEVENATIISS